MGNGLARKAALALDRSPRQRLRRRGDVPLFPAD